MARLPRLRCGRYLGRRPGPAAWLAGLCLLALQGTALAVGLGRLTVQSALDEPLSAEIALTGVTAKELRTLRAGLAPLAQFQKAGIPRPEALRQVRIEVDKDAQPPRLRITSDRPFREPFLHFLVQLDWAGGRLVKEYTALLDPPLYVKGKAPPISPPSGAEAARARPLPETAVAPTPAAGTSFELLGPEDLSEGRSPVYDVGPVARPGGPPRLAGQVPAQIGPTQRGDTLWSLVRGVKPLLKASEYQIMLSLLRENPDAFRGGNVNRLKVGKILKLPAPEEIRAIPLAEARREYRAQLESWEALRRRLAGARPARQPKEAGPAAAKPEAAGKTEKTKPATGKAPARPAEAGLEETAEAAAKPAPGPEKPVEAEPAKPQQASTAGSDRNAEAEAGKPGKEPGDLLRIVQATLDQPKDEASAAAGAGSGAPAAQAGLSDGEKAALRNKIQTLEEAVVSSEAENRELRERLRLLEEQVAKAQRLFEMQDQDLALAQQQAAQRQAQADRPEPAPQPAAQTRPAPAPPPVRREPVAPKEDFLDALMSRVTEAWVVWVAGGAAVVILAILGLWMYRRRRSIAEFEESILSGSALDSRTHTAPSEQVSSGTDTSFLSDFGMPGMGSVHADEVDPVAEAEVYLAYGRTEQAEEVLKDAAAKYPDRPEIKLKLLEIYEQRKDLKAFETLAEELYPAEGAAGDPTWAKVVEMGRRINPDNPLFKGEAGAAPAAPAAKPAAAEEAELEPFPAPDEVPAAEEGLSLDLEDFLSPEESGTPPQRAGAASQAAETGLQGTAKLEGTTDLSAELAGAAGGAGAPAAEPPAGESSAGEVAAPPPEATATLELEQGGAGGQDLGELDLGSTAELEGQLGAVGAGGADEHAISWEEPEVPPASAEAQPEGGELSMPAESLDETLLADLEVPGTAGEPAPVEKAAAEQGNGGDGEDLAQWDEAATKLDLAKAYIDMGDKDGARSILDEVLAEGNEQQKKQASELAAQLGG